MSNTYNPVAMRRPAPVTPREISAVTNPIAERRQAVALRLRLQERINVMDMMLHDPVMSEYHDTLKGVVANLQKQLSRVERQIERGVY